MRVLLLSDSHGAVRRMQATIEREADCKTVFFLGDGLSDLEQVRKSFSDRNFVAVCGNMDLKSAYTSYDDFAYKYLEGHTIIATHGHRVSVRSTLTDYLAKAQGVLADIALYGHTHRQDRQMRAGVLFVNPGALCDGKYAVLTLTKTQADVAFCTCAF